MQIAGFTKTYLIYSIKCNVTGKVYVGSTSNLTARLNTHISSFKTGISKCSSVKVLENGNFSVSVLRDNILNVDDTKLAELNFINAFAGSVVNVNKPMTCSKGEYMKNYMKEYRKKQKTARWTTVENQLIDTCEDESLSEILNNHLP